MAAARELMSDAPRELGCFAVMLTAPPADPFPPSLQGRRAVSLSFAWCGDIDEGGRVLAPLYEAEPPELDLMAPMPYTALQSMIDETAPHGRSYYDRLHYLDEVSDGLIDALVDAFEKAPTPQTHIITGWMGGAVDDVSAGATAFGHRGVGAETWLIGCDADGPVNRVADWVRRTHDGLAPHATGGTYVNALEPAQPIADAYEAPVLDRLVAVKRRYDPDGVFSGNGIS
jgi:berberine-like enzyme